MIFSIPKPAFKKIFILYGFLFIFLILAIFFALIWLIEPTVSPQNLRISNLTDSSATVSWTTPQKRTKGFVHYSTSSSFPLFSFLPFPKTEKALDDTDRLTQKIGRYTLHHVALNSLQPNTRYYFKIYTGFHRYGQGSFTTGSTLKTLGSPQPVYGQATDDQKKPVVGALVYLALKNGEKQSALLSTLTNKEGRWQLDLGNARSGDLKNAFPVTAQTQEELVVEAGTRGKGKIVFSLDNDAPAPTIILK